MWACECVWVFPVDNWHVGKLERFASFWPLSSINLRHIRIYISLAYTFRRSRCTLSTRVFKDQEHNAFILFACVILLLTLHTFHPFTYNPLLFFAHFLSAVLSSWSGCSFYLTSKSTHYVGKYIHQNGIEQKEPNWTKPNHIDYS